ncbi:MAG: TlyA family rRNA (cytidine-2'-O)-methyltransferase, partial [Actinobacteria bacterium]|nr:TlyA family rRNA (cytidine-2'-O)-methyltransferase [Actinomycetota bacterium]
MKNLITALIERKLVNNSNAAESLILEGRVRVNGIVKDKPGIKVSDKSVIDIKQGLPFVSRGGLKIQQAFSELGISVKNKKTAD